MTNEKINACEDKIINVIGVVKVGASIDLMVKL